MQAAFEKLRAFFHGCEYEQALRVQPQHVLLVYLHAIDQAAGFLTMDPVDASYRLHEAVHCQRPDDAQPR